MCQKSFCSMFACIRKGADRKRSNLRTPSAKMMFQAFAKNLFGTGGGQLKKTLFIYLLVFCGLDAADYHMQISPFILYLMTGTFTAGIMWQCLSSTGNAGEMQNIYMLPFENRQFALSYTAALGAYTLLTKTAGLYAVLLAVSDWGRLEIFGGILCAANAVLMAACIYAWKKYRYAGIVWAVTVLATMYFLWDSLWFFAAVACHSVLAFLFLWNADGYSFCNTKDMRHPAIRSCRRYLVWHYLFRYLRTHKNYLANTAILWCIACVLPVFLGQMGNIAAPIGFAILSLNTPVCILLSADPACEQAVRFLPGQKKAFLVPYCLFIFLCSILADAFFLCSLWIFTGSVTGWMFLAAVFFALQSAVFSVLLEWFFPILAWKTESGLWHHPRKYIVPSIMFLLAGAVSAMPSAIFLLAGLLVVEILVLVWRCWREF